MDKTICALPFMAVDRHFEHIGPCCHYKNKQWKKYESIEQYWNSRDLKSLQRNILDGNRDPGCHSCWKMEDIGQISLRQSINISRLSQTNLINPKITQVKLLTGKVCNLACMMCFSSISSTYQQLWKDRSDWIMPGNKIRDIMYDYNMDRYIREHAEHLSYIEALGGEPLFSKTFLDLLLHLIQTGHHKHLTLFIITNGTLMSENLLDVLAKFQKTVLCVSVDGVGAVNEYQRWPSSWNTVQTNLNIMAQNFDLSILPTVTALNICGLAELYEYCDKKNIVINNTNLVNNWPQLLPCNLPEKMKSKVDTKFMGFFDGVPDTESLFTFIKQWDLQRGISIVDYMPDWTDVL